MKVAIRCSLNQQQEWLSKPQQVLVDYLFYYNDDANFFTSIADVYFDLCYSKTNTIVNQQNAIVFVNNVVETCNNLPKHYVRINAWSGFLQREIIEVASSEKNYGKINEVMKNLGWKYQLVADEPGMIAARIIAMIINEAYFALEDDVSSKSEIDIAMKLGTNYLYGPFEWSEKIGLKNIHTLLLQLSATDARYVPCKLLSQSIIHE